MDGTRRPDPRPVVLAVAGLGKTFPPKRRGETALAANIDLTVEVRSGEIVALLGPNGAGKSTFLKQVAGQLLPTEGSIEVAGVDMVASPRAAKEHLAVIPQECDPVGSLTAREHLHYFGRIKGLSASQAPEVVATTLERVGLSAHADRPVRDLSGGLKRRVLIAVALAGRGARLLLLDEPTTGLDPEARRQVWRILEDLRSEGLGILLTTHYIEEAEQLADRVLIIDRGRFVARGSPSEIRDRLSARGRLEVRNVEHLSPQGRAALERVRAIWRPSLERPDRVRLSVPDPFAPASIALLHELAAAGVPATLAPVSLEDAYLAVVGAEEEPT